MSCLGLRVHDVDKQGGTALCQLTPLLTMQPTHSRSPSSLSALSGKGGRESKGERASCHGQIPQLDNTVMKTCILSPIRLFS